MKKSTLVLATIALGFSSFAMATTAPNCPSAGYISSYSSSTPVRRDTDVFEFGNQIHVFGFLTARKAQKILKTVTGSFEATAKLSTPGSCTGAGCVGPKKSSFYYCDYATAGGKTSPVQMPVTSYPKAVTYILGGSAAAHYKIH